MHFMIKGFEIAYRISLIISQFLIALKLAKNKNKQINKNKKFGKFGWIGLPSGQSIEGEFR